MNITLSSSTARHDRLTSADRGFTLVEILVAIVLVGILSAVAILGINGLTNSGGSASCTASMDAAKTANLSYYTANGSYPTTIAQMTSSNPAFYVLQSGVTLNASGLAASGKGWTMTMTPGAAGATPTFACSTGTGAATAGVGGGSGAGTAACPGSFSGWVGEYYNNIGLTGTPVLCRDDASVNFSWAGGSPAAAVNADNFSVRWSKTEVFSAGTYTFSLGSDDGARLYIDGTVVVDAWFDRSYAVTAGTSTLTAGPHLVVVEYYERGGNAQSSLSWA